MKVLFLNPPFHKMFSRESRSPAVAKSGTLYMPKWLATAAGVAIREGYNVDFIDAPAPSCQVVDIYTYIKDKTFDALVCDCSTPSIVNDISVIEKIQKENPALKIIMVGRHVSAMPLETFAMSDYLKYIAVREYEYIVRDWLNALRDATDTANVKGLAWRNDKGEAVINDPMPAIENLDELPFVSSVYKKYLNINDYYYGHSKYPIITIDTSRGCPFMCSFCAYPQTFSGHKVRSRSVKNVIDEFHYIKENYPDVKAVMFEDDTFILDKKRATDLADGLIAINNKLEISCNQRADVDFDLSFLMKMKMAGIRLFCVGIESGDDKILKDIQKGLNIEMTRKFMKNCKKAGILVNGCFMFGNLNETMETMRKTLRLALELSPDTAQFYPIMIYPGTRVYAEAKKRGLLKTENFSEWLTSEGLHNSVINLPYISNRDVVKFADYCRRKFYLRFSYIFNKTIQSILDLGELKRNLKGFIVFSKYLIPGSFGKS